jgi:hypothetical protein
MCFGQFVNYCAAAPLDERQSVCDCQNIYKRKRNFGHHNSLSIGKVFRKLASLSASAPDKSAGSYFCSTKKSSINVIWRALLQRNSYLWASQQTMPANAEKLVSLARETFSELSTAEEEFFRKNAEDKIPNCCVGPLEDNDPAKADQWGPERTIRADRISGYAYRQRLVH